jgi:hypothetical protein
MEASLNVLGFATYSVLVSSVHAVSSAPESSTYPLVRTHPIQRSSLGFERTYTQLPSEGTDNDWRSLAISMLRLGFTHYERGRWLVSEARSVSAFFDL